MLADGKFEFSLRKPIEVAGVSGEVSTLTFHECGEGYDSYYMKLRRFVMAGMMKAPELMKQLEGFKGDDATALAAGDELKPLHHISEDDHLTESEGLAEVLKLALGMSDDLELMVKIFGQMVGNSGGKAICTADGVRVKDAAFQRVNIEDKIDAAVQYCAFFGIGLDMALKKEPAPVSDLHTQPKAL